MRLVPILLALLAVPLNAADLSSVVGAALSRSPALAETRAREREARSAGDEAFYSRFPRLSARASAMRSDDPLFAFGSLLQERRVTQADFAPDTLNRPGYRTAVHGALELGVPLFTGFELSRARELAKLFEDEAGAYGGEAAQRIRLRAADGFVRGIKDRALLVELDARIAASQKEVESAERLKKQGLVLGSDHQAALAILAGLKAWRARADAEKSAHDAEMSVLVGGPAPEPSGELRDWTPPLEDDGTLVAAALASRPELRAAGLRVSQAGVRQRGAAQSLLPSVDAFAAVETSADGFNDGAAARLVGVRASMAFGDPAYLSRRGRAKAASEAASASRAQQEDMVRGEVLARAAGLRGISATLPDLDESLTRARESLTLVQPLYREGRQSIMEVLRAEEAVARLQDARFEALYRLRSEWAALRAAQGRLDDAAVAALAAGLEASR
ncbi:MAG: TolC family protein [Elusimicrobiota bacterium]